MTKDNFLIINQDPIILSDSEIEISQIAQAVINTNEKFRLIQLQTQKHHLDVFSIIDFRVLSGIIGETFSQELSQINKKLKKNPNIDGYPDLVQFATPEMQNYFDQCNSKDFIKFKYGGIEIKNTFGVKKANSLLQQGESRIGMINKKLEWKAHHQETNNLLALFTDYIENRPTIVSVFYSDILTKDDWNAKQNPKEGSGMTSFSSITKSGFLKLKTGLKICINRKSYLDFLSIKIEDGK